MLDSFDSLRPGAVREAVNGPFREMHAQPASAEDNLGGWSVRVGNWDLPGEKMWQVVETAGGKRLRSCLTACTYDNASIAKGDEDWQDVRVSSTLKLLPLGEGWGGSAGVAFRFQDSQRYYAAVIDEDGAAKILKRVDANWDTLAWSPIDVKPGRKLTITVQAKGAKLRAKIGPVKLEALDGQYTCGRVSLVGCRPAEFGPITVAALPGETERLAAVKAAREARVTAKRSAFGRPVVWRKYDTPGFGSGRRVRLGDLTGSGGLDFLLLQVNQDRQSPNAIGCMTAMSHEGQVLWQVGTPRPFDGNETSTDLPCQIHDIDGDGRAEVVCVYDGEIRILEGATGGLKAAGPLPGMAPLPRIFKENMLDWGAGFNDQGPHLRVGNIAFADLSGRGRRGEILLSDAYHTLVAVGDGLGELWRTVCSHGHSPFPYDFDGDGREDVIAGFHRMSPEGKLLGRVCLQDHQDAIYAGPLDEAGRGPVKVLMAAGEDGLLTLTPEFAIRQRVMGHVQRLAVGRFRRDLPGLCIATVLFHGNPGIISLFDSTVKKLWTKDFPVIGTTLQPVNWDGSGTELMLLSGIRPAQGYPGGLMDGEGELVVPLPDDGGPGFAAFAHDFDGDGLDELMLWDHERIWIYHTDSDAPSGPRYRPVRPPLHNSSNFQAYYSHPRWE